VLAGTATVVSGVDVAVDVYTVVDVDWVRDGYGSSLRWRNKTRRTLEGIEPFRPGWWFWRIHIGCWCSLSVEEKKMTACRIGAR
jgi:hypothetical protein